MQVGTGARTTAALVATGLGAALLAVSPAGSATAASEVTGELRYSCAWGGSTEELTARMTSDAPAEAFYSQGPVVGGLSMTLTTDAVLPARIASDLYAEGGRSLTGRLADPFTVSDGRDERGATLPVASALTPVSLGDQAMPSGVSLQDRTVSFGEVRDQPGYLFFRVRESMDLRLTVTQVDGATKDVSIPCTRVSAAGAWPEVARVAWVAPTETTLEVPRTVEYGQRVRVTPTVTPARGTATGTLRVSAGRVSTDLTVDGTARTVRVGGLPVGAYDLGAAFTPDDSRFYRGSAASVERLRVTRAPVRLRTRVRAAGAGRARDVLRVRVRGVHGTVPSGTVRVTRRSGSGRILSIQRRPLRRGAVHVRVGHARPGAARVRVTYLGDREHRRGHQVQRLRSRR